MKANGDDIIATDDEDGLNHPLADSMLTAGAQPTVNVIVTNNTGSLATLSGWIDYNNDGVFENATERAQAAVANGTSGGIVMLTFPTVPIGFTGQTYARFRLSTDAAAQNPTGAASNGEVEDYRAAITLPSTSTIRGHVKIGDGRAGYTPSGDAELFGSSVASLGDHVLATATDAGGNTSEFSLSRTVASPLAAAGGEASQATRVQSQELGMGDLRPIVDAAVERLAGLGLDASLLASIDVAIADLPGATLGLAAPTSIVIDIDAAGHGWWISDQQSAFSIQQSAVSQRKAARDPHSELRNPQSMDLLTVAMHELGQVAGLDDLHKAADEDDLMNGRLEAGQRRTSLDASLADAAFAGE